MYIYIYIYICIYIYIHMCTINMYSFDRFPLKKPLNREISPSES